MNFTSFYSMRMNPFDKDLKTKDAFMSSDMKQMQGRLEHLKDYPGIGLFTAPPGMGKTFALRYFSESLNPNLVRFHYICLSTVTTAEFYRQLCVELGLEVSYKKSVMFKRIQDHIYSMKTNKNIHVIICLDEAQYLNPDILKDLKMICNFCMDSLNCFTLILLGQPYLTTILSRDSNEALRQRIKVNYSFRGLTESEALSYISDRMELAGSSSKIFDDNAMVAAYSSCNGSLRQLNSILTKALMLGAQNNATSINTDMILSSVNDISLV